MSECSTAKLSGAPSRAPSRSLTASNATGRHQAIQVKAIASTAWQFDIRDFVNVTLEGKRQVIGRPNLPPYPGLICVFVRLRQYGADEFYILTWEDLQKITITNHREYLRRHGGIRPKKHDSFHTAVRPEMLNNHRDRWEVFDTRLQDAC